MNLRTGLISRVHNLQIPLEKASILEVIVDPGSPSQSEVQFPLSEAEAGARSPRAIARPTSQASCLKNEWMGRG